MQQEQIKKCEGRTMNSYVKIDRNILDWEWWSDIKTCRLFLYMILKANWKDGNFKGINVPRGSFVSSVAKLSEGTNLTVDEVRTALKHLKSTNEITSKSYGKFTIFTINNYNTYQDNTEKLTNKAPNKSQEDTEQIPSKSQADTKQTPSKSQVNTEQIPNSCQEDTEQIPSSSRANPEQFPTIEERKEEKENRTVIVSNETICQTDVQRVIEKWNELQGCGITPISDNDNQIIEDMELLNKYKFIGTVEDCREARERQKGKKPILNENVNIMFCPICERKVKRKFDLYCSGCGQKLDWSE